MLTQVLCWRHPEAMLPILPAQLGLLSCPEQPNRIHTGSEFIQAHPRSADQRVANGTGSRLAPGFQDGEVTATSL